jgi:hypothetical protein
MFACIKPLPVGHAPLKAACGCGAHCDGWAACGCGARCVAAFECGARAAAATAGRNGAATEFDGPAEGV